MVRRHALSAAAIGLVLMCQAAGVHAAPPDRHTSHITFRGEVALRGITLVPGTYVFEQVAAGTPDVVVVRSLDRRTLYFMGLTQPSSRPASLAPGQVVTFGEPRRGRAPVVTGWYPSGEDVGHAFVE